MKAKLDFGLNRVLDIVLIVLILSIGYIGIMKEDSKLKIYIVASGSMIPTLYPGDVIATWHTKEEKIKIGDIITYQIGNSTITHRVFEKEAENFITKGDANYTTDELINYEQIIGKVIMVIPKLGYLLEYFTISKMIVFIFCLSCIGLFIFYRGVI